MTTTLILHTLLALLLLALPFAALYLLDRPSIKTLGAALIQGTAQLTVFILIIWALYKADSIWLSLGWLLVMTLWAAWLAVSRCHLTAKRHLLPATAGLLLGNGLVTLWFLTLALPSPTIAPRWFIPTTALLLGHSTAMLIRGLSNYNTMLNRNRPQYDYLRGNGATPWQAQLPFLRTSLLAVITPTTANLTTLSLATTPLLLCGMLTAGMQPISALALMLGFIAASIAASVLTLAITLVLIIQLHTEKVMTQERTQPDDTADQQAQL
jgi:putative ABC transport system permease protein